MILDTAAYLSRIGLEGERMKPDADTLRKLQLAHLTTVPFENLDIHWSRPIVLDKKRIYEKIVIENRGGFCYELNGLFIELLKELGFRTRLISARVFNGNDFGPEFDHAAIIVRIGGDEFLADVGFGDFTAEPLRFVLGEVQADRNGNFVIRKHGSDHLEVAKQEGDKWTSQYMFKDIAYELSDFEQMCEFQQYSPESHFRKSKICSILTSSGRKTLTDNKFIVTTGKSKTEIAVETSAEFEQLLADEFNIVKL